MFAKFYGEHIDKHQAQLIKGSRSTDNCYMWRPQENNQSQSCMISKIDETKLCHRKFDHLNLRSMRKMVSKKTINGLPNLKIEENNICGEC